jgi:hypothetical protein
MSKAKKSVVMYAYVGRDGIIHFETKMADGALPVSLCYEGQNVDTWKSGILQHAAYAVVVYTDKSEDTVSVVPGVIEAGDDDEAAMAALIAFNKKVGF